MILMNICLRTLILTTSLYLNSLLYNYPPEIFSIIHTNVRSRFFHHNELVSLSAQTNLNLDVIAVSQILHSIDNPLSSNVDITGYNFFKTQSLTQNGGVSLYIKDSLTSNPRTDLDSCTDDFEGLKLKTVVTKNFLIFCVYRHPCSAV